MDINTQLTYVTCIYDDLFGTEFGGRPDPVWRRYYYGLQSATKVMAPIVIFTWSKNVNKVETHFRNFLGEERFSQQIKVLPYDLQNSPFYELIKSIKTEEQGYNNDRSYDLMIAKFIFLQHCIQHNYFSSDYIFWLDAGLSHIALFPEKYLDKTHPDTQYTECSLFTEKVLEASIRKSESSILLFKCKNIGHWLPPEHTNQETLSPENLWYIIGGYFGGPLYLMNTFCEIIMQEFRNYIENYNLLLLEEPIMTLHASHNYTDYVYEEFDVWHHENSGEWAQPYIIGKKSFHKIFEEFNSI